MKVRISMPGAAAVVDLEENKAGKVFKELAGQLLGFSFREDTESVKGLLEEPAAEEEQKEEPPEMAARKEPLMAAGQGYKGFLYIRCSKCGKTKGFCSKLPLKYHQCECGNREELHDLALVFARCECGNSYKYLTNIEDAIFDVPCFKCGSPMSVQWNAKKRVYEPIRD